MPYKANEPRRHKIPRARYKVRNWPEYDRALQQRGSLTVWVTPEALAAWHPPCTGQRGRPRDYSDVAIETGHLLRLAFGRPWRQTEGLLHSRTTLLGVSLGVPDHTTFSRRSPGLALAAALTRAQASGPVHVVIDATGLKVYGAGEWLVEKHDERGKRTWRKLHLAVDPSTGEILASELTSNEEGDASQVGPLLDQIPGPLASVTADGAYDGEPVYRRGGAPARPTCGGDHPAALNRRAEPGRGLHAQSAGPAHPDDPGQGAPGLAEGGRLRPALAWGDRDVPLQDRHRSWPAGPGAAGPEDRSPGRLRGAQPDDPARDAGVAAHRLKARPSYQAHVHHPNYAPKPLGRGLPPPSCRTCSAHIGIGGNLAAPPLPHHRTYGSVY